MNELLNELREIEEIDICPKCGYDSPVFHNKANQKAWACCPECGEETPLKFTERYTAKKHKYAVIAGYTHVYSHRPPRKVAL